MAYHLEGRLLEVCTCKILCPCWVGEDPDFGTCDGVLAWHFDKGTIDGVDVAGHTFVILAHIPGNILKGNWKIRVYIDDKATPSRRMPSSKSGRAKPGDRLRISQSSSVKSLQSSRCRSRLTSKVQTAR